MKIFTVCTSLLAVFLITACGDIEESRSFDSRLHGTWISNEPSLFTSKYSGSLIISYDRITITGYYESQTKSGEDDTKRPFRNFTKGDALKGYSEEGKFFIEDRGLVQEGIPYVYWDDNPPPDYKKVKFLSFTFGGRTETLKNIEN